MSESFPYGEVKWIGDEDKRFQEEDEIMNIPEDSDVGYIFEVDLEYPNSVHNTHNDLPFCAEVKCATRDAKTSKLIPDLTNKIRYVIHYGNLQQCLKHELKLLRVHRVLQIKQSCWLKNRTLATNKLNYNNINI